MKICIVCLPPLICTGFDFDITDREKVKDFIKAFLDKLEHLPNIKYDYVFFDCPPNFNALTYSVLSSAALVLVPINPNVLAARGINQLIEGLTMRLKPWKEPKIAVLMNKAKTISDKYLTSESKMYLNEVKRVKTTFGQKGIVFEVFDSYIPARVDIRSAIHNPTFPLEYEEYFNNLWQKINSGRSQDLKVIQSLFLPKSKINFNKILL